MKAANLSVYSKKEFLATYQRFIFRRHIAEAAQSYGPFLLVVANEFTGSFLP